MGFLVFLCLFFVGFTMLFGYLAQRTKDGKLPMGSVGLRTPDTLKSEKAWAAANRVLSQYYLRLCQGSLAAAAVMVGLIITKSLSPERSLDGPALWFVTLPWFVWLMVGLIGGVTNGNRAARQADPRA